MYFRIPLYCYPYHRVWNERTSLEIGNISSFLFRLYDVAWSMWKRWRPSLTNHQGVTKMKQYEFRILWSLCRASGIILLFILFMIVFCQLICLTYGPVLLVYTLPHVLLFWFLLLSNGYFSLSLSPSFHPGSLGVRVPVHVQFSCNFPTGLTTRQCISKQNIA